MLLLKITEGNEIKKNEILSTIFRIGEVLNSKKIFKFYWSKLKSDLHT
jgi:hypothetical protein